jgi:hypothetical protein
VSLRRYARRPWARASTGDPRHPRSSPAGRDLRISAASGAYVAAIPAAAWTLTGYGVDGERLGALTIDHRDSEG